MQKWNETPAHATFTENNHFHIDDFFDVIEKIFSVTDKYSIQKTNDFILITDRINNKQVLKAQDYNNEISVVHDGNNNTWLALFNAMHKTRNFKCEFSFTGNNEERKKLAVEFLHAVSDQIDKNDGILDDAIFDIDEETKDTIYQVLQDKEVIERLGDKILMYFGLSNNSPHIKSKNAFIFETTQTPRKSFKMG